jgi:hypothetical protein
MHIVSRVHARSRTSAFSFLLTAPVGANHALTLEGVIVNTPVTFRLSKGSPAMPNSGMHVVAGVGPVGRAILDELVDRRLPVRAVVRRQVADLPDEVEVVEADLTDPDVTPRAMAGASVVYHAASAPYDRWPALLPPLMRGILAGAVACGARIVYADNLYAYGPVRGPSLRTFRRTRMGQTAASGQSWPTT